MANEPTPFEHFPDEYDWLRSEPGVPFSEDFVERTLRAVLADQAEIADEARRVDEVEIPTDLMAQYEVPEIDTDFVDTTLGQVLDEQSGRQAADARLDELLKTFHPPVSSPAFIERTLKAIRQEQPQRRRSNSMVAAAALLLIPLTWLVFQALSTPSDSDEVLSTASQFNSPVARTISAHLDASSNLMPLEHGSGLLALIELSRTR